MSEMMRRPSITWKMPRRTILSGSMPLMLFAGEADVAARDRAVLGLQQAGDRFERGRFAGAIGAEQGDDLAFRHLEAEAAQHQDDVVVDDLDVVDREQAVSGRRPAARVRR